MIVNTSHPHKIGDVGILEQVAGNQAAQNAPTCGIQLSLASHFKSGYNRTQILNSWHNLCSNEFNNELRSPAIL